MQRNDLAEIRDLVAATLPASYEHEPLFLTFYGRNARRAGDDILIGDDYAGELHVRADGSVISVEAQGGSPVRFVNTSVAHLARLLSAFSSLGIDDARADWSSLAAIDPAAFASQQNWWPEQLREELD